MTHDYKRHGTTTLFAALNVLDGTVLGRCMQRHRHQEFIRFLNAAEAAVPAGKIVHAILDNYAVHKHPRVRAWLSRHPRWVFHFTPTSASWLNAVEGFFSALTRRRLRRGDFISLVDLQGAIKRYIAEHNNDPVPSSGRNRPSSSLTRSNATLNHLNESVHSYVRLQGFWAKQFSSGPCRTVRGDGIRRHGMGDGALRRRSIKLLCAGWLPHSVFRPGASPV